MILQRARVHKMRNILLIFLAIIVFSGSIVKASEDAKHPKKEHWPFDGFFGKFEREAAQRGYKVYKEVCSACHSMDLIAFRTLKDIGFSEGEVKALAAEYQISDGPNDQGEMFQRPRTPADFFPAPFPNEQAARASNGGAYPPDLSLIIKARADGANYIYSLLTGFNEENKEKLEIPSGMYYNPYFPGHKIAMAPPLSDGQVTYDDGTNATVDQMAKDVVVFLQWAAEPEMEARKRMGIKTLLFLLVFTGLFIEAKRRIWKDVK
jgi:ubiquinol-cytochrome c reductase cytochrome c1 subunit